MRANEKIAKFLTVLDNLDKKGIKMSGLVMSSAGAGKTSTIEKWCSYKNYKCLTLIPSNYAPDDILGLQTLKDGRLQRVTPVWFDNLLKLSDNGNNRVCLFIDEITTSDPYIQAPLLNVIFNRVLEDKVLPNNVFIVAGGNYSDELNNAFKLSVPLVNRFVILNLESKDFSIKEVLNGSFENLNTNKEIEKYFNIIPCKKAKYDYDKFADWVENSGEVSFNKAEIDEENGLKGFTSVRSLNYSMKFACEYFNTFDDSYVFNVVGDTLGKSEKREGIAMSDVLNSNKTAWINTKSDEFGSDKISENLKTIFNKLSNDLGLIEDSTYMKKVSTYIKSLSRDELTNGDVKQIIDIVKLSKHKNMKEINNVVTALLKG